MPVVAVALVAVVGMAQVALAVVETLGIHQLLALQILVVVAGRVLLAFLALTAVPVS
jgi:hypothetical protein